MSLLYPSSFISSLFHSLVSEKAHSQTAAQTTSQETAPSPTLRRHRIEVVITAPTQPLDFRLADQLSKTAYRRFKCGTVVLDLTNVRDATTPGLARLVQLRQLLLRRGRDLRLKGLSQRAAHQYEMLRLQAVIPQA